MLPEPKQGNEDQLSKTAGWTSSKTPATTNTNPKTGQPITSDVVTFDATQAAKSLQKYRMLGRFSDTHGYVDINSTALGQKVNSQCGGMVDLDVRTMQVVIWLIENGYKIGTYAWCSDHHCDGMTGHSGGHAVDIAEINGIAINQEASGNLVLEVDTLLNMHAPQGLKPRQLISGGFGNHRDARCTSLCITDPPGSDPDQYYTSSVMGEHCNHIHVGY